jgi:hypothetical protein
MKEILKKLSKRIFKYYTYKPENCKEIEWVHWMVEKCLICMSMSIREMFNLYVNVW